MEIQIEIEIEMQSRVDRSVGWSGINTWWIDTRHCPAPDPTTISTTIFITIFITIFTTIFTTIFVIVIIVVIIVNIVIIINALWLIILILNSRCYQSQQNPIWSLVYSDSNDNESYGDDEDDHDDDADDRWQWMDTGRCPAQDLQHSTKLHRPGQLWVKYNRHQCKAMECCTCFTFKVLIN